MHTVNRRTGGERRMALFSTFGIAPPNRLRVNIRSFMKHRGLTQFALSGVVALLFCSCEDMQQQLQKPLAAIMPTPTPMPGWWEDFGAHGDPRIVVNITEQKAYFYKGKRLVGESTVSTGKKGFGTPPGHYSSSRRTKTTTRVNSGTTWTAGETSSFRILTFAKILNRRGRISIRRGCRIACISTADTRCIRDIVRPTRRRMVASACPRGWRLSFTTTRRSGRRLRSKSDERHGCRSEIGSDSTALQNHRLCRGLDHRAAIDRARHVAAGLHVSARLDRGL